MLCSQYGGFGRCLGRPLAAREGSLADKMGDQCPLGPSPRLFAMRLAQTHMVYCWITAGLTGVQINHPIHDNKKISEGFEGCCHRELMKD